MIVRILGVGQFEVSDDRLEALNEHDEAIVRAVEAGDEVAFDRSLEALLAGVREAGRPVPDDHLGSSDLMLPGPDATIEDVRVLLSEEGLIPG